MRSFASSLSERIEAETAFWTDYAKVSAGAMRRIIPPLAEGSTARADKTCLQRMLQSASVFSQSDEDRFKNLAQELAVYASITSDDASDHLWAREILVRLGNHPGADQLDLVKTPVQGSFISELRRGLAREWNAVMVGSQKVPLTDFQLGVWGALQGERAIAISAPTSAGKSYVIVEHLCQRAVAASDAFTAVFIAPTRALLAEVQTKISGRLAAHSEIRVTTIPSIDPEQRKKQIFVLTQERLQVLLTIWNGVFQLVVVDEAQALGDDSRGMILQDCIEILRARSTETRFLFLTPGASGFDELMRAVDIDQIDIQDTDVSPVVQNRIVVAPVAGNDKALTFTLLCGANRTFPIGQLQRNRGFGSPETRLAAVALELGKDGGSLVYGPGPAEADNIAGQIASELEELPSPELEELSSFVRKHVHPRYSLVTKVKRGVGVHYGKMPTLLREALEEAFKAQQLSFLVCTTTLFQGVNLPARNVFLDTPSRSKRDLLDAAALWNFAGRAGRLGKDIVGNVFLVGYDGWEIQPLTDRAKFQIQPSFRRTLETRYDAVLARLKDAAISIEKADVASVEAAAGLLISRAARGTLSSLIARSTKGILTQEREKQLLSEATDAHARLGLPEIATTANWTVNPFGQARLLTRIREKIAEGEIEDLLPLHPGEDGAYERYVQIFARINREVTGSKVSNHAFNKALASVSLAWMAGKPLPVIIDQYLRYSERMAAEKNRTVKNIDSKIRRVFSFVEDTIRFRYVQLGRAYIDLLRYALIEADHAQLANSVYDFPLALELGVSSPAGQVFIELGLSRISASVFERLIPNSQPSIEQARSWLSTLRGDEFELSQVIWDEARRKGLISTAA